MSPPKPEMPDNNEENTLMTNEEQEVKPLDVDNLIAGALFDFVGYLTTRTKAVRLGARHEATPAMVLLTNFAKSRGLDLSGAEVNRWAELLTVVTTADLSSTTAGVKGPHELLTVTEYVDRYRVSRCTVYREIKAGRIESIRIGRGRNIRVVDRGCQLRP